jgi:chemotaxis protein MotB
MSDAAAAPEPEPCKCEAGAPKWMVTFGDMMSLLLCFFVLLLSFSTTDIIKYEQLKGSLKDAFGMAKTNPDFQIPSADLIIATTIEVPPSVSALVSVRAKARQRAKSSSELEMESGADWVRIKVDGDALFESGSYRVSPGGEALLAGLADMVNEFQGTIMIEGHTDNQRPANSKFGPQSFFGNYELASMRAISVMEYFVTQQSVDAEKLIPLSHGDTRPRETNDDPRGRARNRRVEFEFRTSSQNFVDNADGEVVGPGGN